MRFDTVLFELEGVLADTAALRRDALRRSLADDGVPLSDEDFAARCTGLPPRAAANLAARRRGVVLDDTALDLAALRAERYFAEASAHGVSLVPGARELVESLAASARLAIVTRATRRDVDLVLGLAGLDHAIETIVTADDRVEPKPHPSGYVLAVERLSRRRPVDRERALALEDGPAGIAAAGGAGLTCVVVGEHPAHEAMRAVGVVPSLQGLTLDRLAAVAGDVGDTAR